jgi:hypothetical protein
MKTKLIGLLASACLIGSALPAQASWTRLVPSGAYANINGKEFFVGDFVRDPNPRCPVHCTWAVRMNGRLSAHGAGRTPRWVLSLLGIR